MEAHAGEGVHDLGRPRTRSLSTLPTLGPLPAETFTSSAVKGSPLWNFQALAPGLNS